LWLVLLLLQHKRRKARSAIKEAEGCAILPATAQPLSRNWILMIQVMLFYCEWCTSGVLFFRSVFRSDG
jgi:hypothetical protein